MSLKDIELVLTAASAFALFGSNDEKVAKKEYRRLVRTVHPDLFTTSDPNKARAEEAFKRLTVLWNQVRDVKTVPTNAVHTRKHEYIVGSMTSEDEVFARFDTTYDAGHKQCQMLVAKSVRDADLVSAYVSALRKLREAPEKYRIYFPQMLETFRYRQSDGDHGALTVEPIDGFYTLRQVKERYPSGIGGRDIAWMFRRMLVALGNTHDVGLVHGAPTLDAFHIHPEMHGMVLGGWQYSVSTDSPLVAVPVEFKSLYPEAALSKKPVDYRLDLVIASKVANELLAPTEPRALRAFFKGCQVATPPRAAYLLAEFDDLLERLYGKRAFHPFTMTK